MKDFIHNFKRNIFLSKPFVFLRKIKNTSTIISKLSIRSDAVDLRRNRDVEVWKDGRTHKTDAYKKLNQNALMLLDFVQKYVNKNDSILDICCNQGRFLFYLKSKGYSRLYGFDIMSTAINTIRAREDYNPEVIKVEHCLAQDYFSNKAKNQFDWAITYSATIELINPEFDIFKELSRTIRKGMFLVINENGHAYPRFYRFLHRVNGFKILETITLGDKTLIFSKKIK